MVFARGTQLEHGNAITQFELGLLKFMCFTSTQIFSTNVGETMMLNHTKQDGLFVKTALIWQ